MYTLCICIYIYDIYIYIYICVYIHIYIFVYICVYIYIYQDGGAPRLDAFLLRGGAEHVFGADCRRITSSQTCDTLSFSVAVSRCPSLFVALCVSLSVSLHVYIFTFIYIYIYISAYLAQRSGSTRGTCNPVGDITGPQGKGAGSL